MIDLSRLREVRKRFARHASTHTRSSSHKADDVAWIGTLYEWIEAAVFSLICVILLFTFFFRIVGVDGNSMKETLHDKERLILRTIAYTPERGDIVVIDRYTLEPLVKRVIAVGGDTLEIDGETGRVILNGVVQEETFIKGITRPIQFEGRQTVPKGYVFVMGDNREDSHDSRMLDIGFVDVRDIVGKAVFRLWPLTRIGPLH